MFLLVIPDLPRSIAKFAYCCANILRRSLAGERFVMPEFAQAIAASLSRSGAESIGSSAMTSTRWETFQATRPDLGFGINPVFSPQGVATNIFFTLPWPGGLSFTTGAAQVNGGNGYTDSSGYGNQGGIAYGEIVEMIKVVIQTTLSPDGPRYGQTWRDYDTWSFLSNGPVSQTLDVNALTAPSPTTPQQVVRFEGNAAALIATLFGDVTGFYCSCEVRDRFARYERSRLTAFIDDSQGSDTNLSYPFLLGELEKQLSGGVRDQVGTTGGGVGIFADDCAGAFVPWDGCLFIEPADPLIPALFANNTAAIFRQRPSVFFRRSQYIRRLEGMNDAEGISNRARIGFDPRAITAFQPFALLEVVRAPTHSRWGFVVDGHYEEVIIAHPAASDFRTGLDIWNNVIVPAIRASSARGLDLPFFRVHQVGLDFTAPLTFSQIGILRSLEYLQYAELKQHYDANASTPIYNRILQA